MLFRNTRRKIGKSFGRYLSFLTIILIGVAFCAGITISTTNIREIQKDYYENTHLMDVQVQSTLGLTKEDKKALQKIEGIEEVVGSYSKAVLTEEDVLILHAIESKINQVDLVEGRMPQREEECLADSTFYKVGDKIDISSDVLDSIKGTSFKVVGTIRSPLYTGTDYGNTEIGGGKVKSFLFIPKENFKYPTYTEIYITIHKEKKDSPYSTSYLNKVKEIIKKIEGIKEEREKARYEEVVQSYFANPEHLVSPSIQSTWHISSREDVVTSYSILNTQYEQVEIIAHIIPLFFIVIVILMTSNTMMRMIVEERGEMGALSSLGVSNFKVAMQYILYVLSSTILGTAIGYFIGTYFIPLLIYDCFPVTMPPMQYHFRFSLLFFILLFTTLIMSIVTLYACHKALKEKPAYLLRPISPKSGKKILLERIHLIWDHLSFSWKVTLRNIARYKKRVFMTLIGTAGCTFLILIGFAIKDSINGVGNTQYTNIFRYDMMLLLKTPISSKEDIPSEILEKYLEKEVLLQQAAYKVTDTKYSLDAYLTVPAKEIEDFSKYFILKDVKTKEPLHIEEGVIVSAKIGQRFSLQKGDSIYLEDVHKKRRKVRIEAVTENYVANYVYMSTALYEKVFKESPTYNTIVGKVKKEENQVVKKLLNSGEILRVNTSEDLKEEANRAIGGLNHIIVLLVVISSLLCFTVLYNLTSINISERKREIATLKVLGFKDTEANNYIYRETIITVLFGILLGLLMTPFLHHYIMNLMEADNMLFARTIKVESYIYASLMTLAFALIMELVTYLKLKKIDMIESLKSVE